MLKNIIKEKIIFIENKIDNNRKQLTEINFPKTIKLNFYKNIEYESYNKILSNIKKDIIKDTYYLSYKNHIKYEELGKRLNEIKINNFDNLINLSDEKNIVNEIFYYYENMFFYFLKKLKNNSLFLFHSNYDIYNQFNLNSNLESLNFYSIEKNINTKDNILKFIDNLFENYNISFIDNFKKIFNNIISLCKNNEDTKLKILENIKIINSKKIILKNISYEFIENNDNFLLAHLKNYENLKKIITLFEYENNIIDYNNDKIKIVNLLKKYYL